MKSASLEDQHRARVFMEGQTLKKILLLVGALIVAGAAVGGALYYVYPVQVTTLAGLTRNYLLSWSAPAGTATTESNAAYKSVAAVAPSAAAPSPSDTAADWPSYNRTLTSERYSQLSEINTKNVRQAEGFVHLRRR